MNSSSALTFAPAAASTDLWTESVVLAEPGFAQVLLNSAALPSVFALLYSTVTGMTVGASSVGVPTLTVAVTSLAMVHTLPSLGAGEVSWMV